MMKKKELALTQVFIISAFSLIWLVAAIIPVYAQDADATQSRQVTPQELKANVSETQEDTQNEELDAVFQEAFKAYEQTVNAIEALEQNDSTKALEALEKAVGKLNIVLGRRPELALIPISSRVERIDIISDLPTIEEKRAHVEYLIQEGHLQAARRLLDDLVSEIRVTTTNLPMETYPVAIRGIARLIEEDQIVRAKAALQQVLSTLVIIERSIPIPVVNSQFLIAEAQKFAAGKPADELSSDQKEKALTLLDQAKGELKVAEALGYGKRDKEFREIRQDIKEIEKKIQKSQKTDSLFQKLKERLQLFRAKISG
jgi:hypothetical protein